MKMWFFCFKVQSRE